MTTSLGRRGMLLLGAASFVGLHGCDAPGPTSGTLASARPVSFVQTKAAEAASDFAFGSLDIEGEETVLRAVSVTRAGVTVTAEELRITDLMQDADGLLSGARIVATGIVYAGSAAGQDQDDDTTLTWTAKPVRIDEVRLDDFRYRKLEDMGAQTGDEMDRQAMAAALSSFAFGQMRIEGTSIGDTGRETIEIASMTLDGYMNGVLGDVDVAGITALTPQTDPLAELAVDEANPAAGLLDSPLVRMALTKPDRMEIDRVRLAGADLSGLVRDLAASNTLGLGTPDIAVGDIRIDGQRTYIGKEMAQTTARTEVTDIAFDGVVPTALSARTRGSVTNMGAYAASDERVVGVLRSRGLQKLEGSSKATFAFDPAAGRLSVNAEGKGDDFYAGSFSFDASGLNAAPGTLTDLLDADDMTVDRMTFAVTDEQAIATIFDLLAIESPSSAMELKQQTVGLVTLGALQGAAISPRVPTYAGAVSSFIANGGTLTIDMQPAGGVSSAEMSALLSDPAALIEAMDLTITRTD